MFCIHCGKKNMESAVFCAFCGKEISQIKAILDVDNSTVEWDYNFFRRGWKNGGRWNLTFGVTEHNVRMDNWGQDQSTLLPKIQKYLDNGWQPISPPGPGSYYFDRNTDYAGEIKYTYLSVSHFIVEFRRPAKSRTEKEKQLLGIWQEIHDPNQGFWSRLGNAVFDHRLNVGRQRYEFRKDRTFREIDRLDKKVDSGIFYEDPTTGEIRTFQKTFSGRNANITVNNGILTRKSSSLGSKKFERVL